MNIEKDLTDEQKKILSSDMDIKRIIACAGSGKTTVITRHIIDILSNGLALPHEILSITFTKNAAENMRIRIGEALKEPDQAYSMDIMTFNAFGNEIINQNSLLLGLGKNPRLINFPESWQIIYDIINSTGLSDLKIGKDFGTFVGQILNYILELKKNLIKSTDISKYSREHISLMEKYSSKALRKEEEEIFSYQKEIFDIYQRYENKKISENLLDYADQVFLPYYLLSSDKKILDRYRDKYRFIFIDEFQDTDISQGRLLSLLHKKGSNKMVFVGDDDQSIYSFRGACIENIIDLDKWECFESSSFGNFYLSKNFRSGKRLTDSFTKLLANNKKRLDKRLFANDEVKDSEIIYKSFKTHKEEASGIASLIKNLLIKEIRPKEIAILSRVKRFKKLRDCLEKENIPFEIISPKSLFYEKEIQYLISWLMVINDVSKEIDIANILFSPGYKVSYKDLALLKSIGKKRGLSLLGSIKEYDQADLSKESKKRLSGFLDDLRLYIGNAYKLRLRELIELVYTRSGLKAELLSSFDASSKRKAENVESFIRIASDFELDREGKVFERFIVYLKDIARIETESPDSNDIATTDSVKLMSIHAAKGLEFDVVVIPFLWKKDFLNKPNRFQRFKIPAALRKDDAVEKEKPYFTSKERFRKAKDVLKTEEERRIFYVACSRARNLLVLTHSEYEEEIDLKEGRREKEAVPFLTQLIDGEQAKDDLFEETCGYEGSGYIQRLVKRKEIVAKLNDSSKVIAKALKNTRVDIGSKKDIIDSTNDIFSSINPAYPHIIDKDGISIREKKRPSIKMPIESHSDDSKIFSLSRLLDYMQCPYSYYIRYVKRIPSKISKNMLFGQKVHELMMLLTLLIYHQKDIKIAPGEGPGNEMTRSLGDLHDDFDQDVLKTIEVFKCSDIFFHKDIKTVLLEQLFYLKLEDFYITCQPDRIDLLNNRGIRLYEYKSSYSDGSNLERYKKQLFAYNMLLDDIYDTGPGDIDTRIIFIKESKIDDIKVSRKETDSMRDGLLDAIKGIKSGQYRPLPSVRCRKCEYEDLCI